MIVLSHFRPRLGAIAVSLALVAVSLTLTAVAAELVLRVAVTAPQPPVEGRFRFFDYHPRLGWDLVPNTQQRTTAPDFDVEVRVNVQGMRDDRPYDPVAPPGLQRIVVVGDSFAFGQGVEAHEGIAARMAAALERTEVLNLSVTGYGTDQQLLKLIDDGLSYQPDRVVVALFEGDVFRNTRTEQLGYPKPRFVLESDDRTLRLTNVPVPVPAPRLERDGGWGRRSALGHLVLPPMRSLLEHAGFGGAWPITEAIIGRFAEVCAEAGAELTVIVLPKDQAVEGSGLRKRLHLHTLGQVTAMLTRTGVDYLDLTAALASAWSADPTVPLYFALDGHWTPAGHQVAADAVADHLRRAPLQRP